MWSTSSTPPLPTSACHFSIFFENLCVIAAGPKHFTAFVSADHPILPLPTPCCYPSSGADAFPVAPSITFPPPTVLCIMIFPPISALCRSCAVVPVLGSFPSAGNVVACYVSFPSAPPGNPQRAWGQRRRIFVSLSVTSPNRVPLRLLAITCRILIFFVPLALVFRPCHMLYQVNHRL